MSAKPLDPHGPTHSTRRGQASAGDSNPLYKLIMFFNLLMTFVTTCANEHIVENQSTDSTVSPTQTGGQRMQDIDDATRQDVYALIIILYIMSAVVVVIVDVVRSDGTANKIFLAITHILLLLAGILYLSGDNILLLHRRFEAIIGVTEAKDVRSYMVAISLALMIVSRIIPYVKKLVDDLEKSPQTLDVIYNSTHETWEIRVPRGYHPEWKTDKNWHLKEITDNPPAQQKYPNDSELMYLKSELEIHVFPTIKLVSKSPKDNVTAQVRLMQVCGEFIPRTEIDIIFENISQKKVSNSQIRRTEYHIHQGKKRESLSEYESQILSMKGTSSMIKMSGSWKGTFQITQFTIDNNQLSENPVPHKTAMTFLFGFYVNLIDYTLIADALYTTVLDEITHQDRSITEGYDCPSGHIAVAIIILCLLFIAWVTAIISMLIVSCVMKRSNRYQCLGSWKDFKERISMFIKSNLGSENIDRTIQTKFAEFNSTIEDCCEQEDNPSANYSKCKLWCCQRVIGCVGWCVYIVFIPSFVAIAITIFAISGRIADTIGCTFFQAVLGIVGIIIGLLFIVTVIGIICFALCHEEFSKCCESKKETSNEDERSATRCFQWSMGLILFFVTLILIPYLPMYLIADNQFPWICYLPGNEKKQWDYARYALIIASLVIMNIPTVLYHLLTAQGKSLEKKNYDDEQSVATGQKQDDKSDSMAMHSSNETTDIDLELVGIHKMRRK